MNILYLSSVDIPTDKASGLAIIRQCEAFYSNGHHLELVVPMRSNHNNSVEDRYGIKVTFLLTRIKGNAIYGFGKTGFGLMLFRDSLKMFWLFWKKRHTVDIIYSRDYRLLLLFALLGFGKKCYLEMHTKHEGVLVRFVLRKVRKVIVISEGLKNYYAPYVSRSDIQLEPSGVDLEQFEDLLPTTVLREKLNVPLDARVVGYIGKYTTMGESKGVDELIEAFAEIWELISEAYLLIVGLESGEMQMLQEKCSSLGIPPERFGLHPLNQKKFAEYVACVDIAIANYPDTEHYREYMSPTKLFAYLAGRKIVIASNLPSIRLIASDSVVYVEPGNVEALKTALLNVFAHKDRYSSLCKNTDISRYSWDCRAERILSARHL